MEVRPAPSVLSSGAAPDAPFFIEARLRARRFQQGRWITFDDVRSGDRVMDGDHLRLSVRASEDAYLYLAFCSQHPEDPRYHGLTVYPAKGSIRMIANDTVTVPARTEEIILDDKPGKETLYLILSRVELASADAGLADVIAAARQRTGAVDCGAPLRSTVAGPSPRDKLRRSASRGDSADARRRPVAGAAKPPARAAGPAADRPVVEIERGEDIAGPDGAPSGAKADQDGIAILRYELQHEPAPPADPASGPPASP